jgi:hypothetical protein
VRFALLIFIVFFTFKTDPISAQPEPHKTDASSRQLIISVTVNGQPQANGDGKTVNWALPYANQLPIRDQDDFRIGFGSLSLRDHRMKRIRYQMDGVDREWREATPDQTGITYSHLPAGTYAFHVQAGDGAGTWGKDDSRLSVQVTAPWWRRRYVAFICVAVFLIFMWLLCQHRGRQLNALLRVRVEEGVRKRTELSREIEDTLLQDAQGLILKMEGAALQLDLDGPDRQAFDDALANAETSLGQVRDMVEGLQAPSLSIDALRAVLQEFWDQNFGGARTMFEISQIGPPQAVFDRQTAVAAFIGKEAIRRACSSVEVEHIKVEILFTKNQMTMSIRDDAVDEIPNSKHFEKVKDHLLRSNMQESDVYLEFKIVRQANRGCIVTLVVKCSSGTDFFHCSPRRWLSFFRKQG